MCTRFNLWSSLTELTEYFELFRQPASWAPKYNIRPMRRILTIRAKGDGKRHAELMQWGLVPYWASDPNIGFEMTSVRSDMVATRRAFRGAFQQRRCLIPATGFYEWQKLVNNTSRPWHIFPKNGQPMAFAGVWESWRVSDRTALCSCAIITTEANRMLKGIATQMPVILPVDKWNSWLTHAEVPTLQLTKLLVPFPDRFLEKAVVSNFVNTLRNDSPECIAPIPANRPAS